MINFPRRARVEELSRRFVALEYRLIEYLNLHVNTQHNTR